MPQTRVLADVSGSVWKIEAAVGDQMAEGDTILLLESMKMEIPVPAPHAGDAGDGKQGGQEEQAGG